MINLIQTLQNTNAITLTIAQILWKPLSEPRTYKRLIGRLLYLTQSRSEIAYAVSKLSQFLDAPIDKHILAGLHVLRFLKNHLGQGLFFSSSSIICLKGFFIF